MFSSGQGVGVLQVPLQVTSAGGRVYRLAGTFDLIGPDRITVRTDISDENAADAMLSLTLREGTYTVALSSWILYERDAALGTYLPRLDAALRGSSVRQASIGADATTAVRFELLVPPPVACTGSCLEPVSISGSDQFTVTSLSDGRVYAWGAETVRPQFQAIQNQLTTSVDIAHLTLCAVLRDRTGRCWGSDLYGQIGDGANQTGAFVRPTGLPEITTIRLGHFHACAALVDGRAMCWGQNSFGQLGTGDNVASNVPVAVPGLGNVVQLAVGPTHSCAVRSTGKVLCWGNNDRQQLGDGTGQTRRSPVEAVGIDNAVEVAAGAGISCARLSDRRVKCWGDNQGGLGNGALASSTPVLVSGLSDAAQITAKGSFACARRATGDVVCWGENESGQLGDGTLTPRATPVVVSGLKARLIGAGEQHACATQLSGGTVCWGNNQNNQLGTGVHQTTRYALPVAGLGDVGQLASHHDHSCATRSDGTIACWGKNAHGQLGDRTLDDRALPVFASGAGDSGFGAIAASTGREHSCALTALGGVECWGGNELDQLGDGTGESSLSPVVVPGVALASALGNGDTSTCAITGVDQSVTCWGDGVVAPAGLAPALEVAGHAHQCAVRGDGRVACWGDNTSGQLGDGTTSSRDTAADVLLSSTTALENATDLAAGATHSCALRSDGTVACWGDNPFGELGDGTRTTTRFAVPVVGLSRAIDIAAGDHHSCAVRENGEVFCWGHGGVLGVLGGSARDFATRESSPPRPVTGVTDAVSIAAGRTHTCALRVNGQVSCWGNNLDGEVGIGIFSRSTTPLSVVPPTHRCGNGIVEGNEACDDGNTAGSDTCSPDCSKVTWQVLDRISATPLSAYSISHKLRSAYTGPLIQVRRVSPSSTFSVSAGTDGLLNRASLEVTCGASDCFLATLFDQSPARRDLTQTTTSLQYKVYDGATRQTVTIGDIPALRSISNNISVMRFDALTLAGNSGFTIAYRGRYGGAGANGDSVFPMRIGINGGAFDGREISLRFMPGSTDLFFGTGELLFSEPTNAFLHRIVLQHAANANVSATTMRVDGSEVPLAGGSGAEVPYALSGGRTYLGKHPSDTTGASADSSTLIVWASALSAADLATLESGAW